MKTNFLLLILLLTSVFLFPDNLQARGNFYPSAAKAKRGLIEVTDIAQNSEAIFRIENVEALIFDKGRIFVVPKTPPTAGKDYSSQRGGGTTRPGETPKFPPPTVPIELCSLEVKIQGTPGDDVLVGLPAARNVIRGEGGNDTITGGDCDDIFYTYSQDPSINPGTSTVTGNDGKDVLNTIRKAAEDVFTDYQEGVDKREYNED